MKELRLKVGQDPKPQVRPPVSPICQLDPLSQLLPRQRGQCSNPVDWTHVLMLRLVPPCPHSVFSARSSSVPREASLPVLQRLLQQSRSAEPGLSPPLWGLRGNQTRQLLSQVLPHSVPRLPRSARLPYLQKLSSWKASAAWF